MNHSATQSIDLASTRGPGVHFHKEWNSLAGSAQRHKSLSLYRTERDVNPTPTTTVQTFYDPQETTDVSSQLKKKGNTVVCLKSNVPRFNGASEETKAIKCGPGSYYPDRSTRLAPAFTPRTAYQNPENR
ncbi:Excinuclease ABC subunit A [Phytophthora palmivora]|uniref:Excinuclease ABC subunit A n=1 Tax=Phytophthora palmivora TaxID=4796 RepID=A0A2P4YUB2_9STRA|nr:Excinuclease ABC subunit A [Phytophthora palmivora]